MRARLGVVLLLVGCQAPLEGLVVVGDDPSDDPLRGLDATLRARFDAGDAVFEVPFRETQGLGPVYVRPACSSCHADDARGPGTVRKMVLLDADGEVAADQSPLRFGHTVRPQYTAGATAGVTPPEALEVWVTRRLPPSVFGRGYLEAVADSEIERVAAEQAAGGVVSGRVHRVAWQSEANPDQPFHRHGPGSVGLIGRFGLKARIATVDELVADALQGDMGVTSPMRPEEVPNPDGQLDDARPGVDVDLETVNLAADYVRLLAIPRRAEALDEEAAASFRRVGCAECHVPSLRTREDYPVPLLAGIDAPVYTDLLLHEMGEALADGLRDGDASASEWRTAPLIGMRHQRALLHDGRALDVEEAILAHDGEARSSRERFEALARAARSRLVTFVEGL